ncbi:hypothetical protein MRB53_009278 [Persea americana]|uniref:Uncharacterized protein n=1 Tax=Persea americana TaxID=3435 RepID=A0ACC2LNM2_PERAE|nr:hypothetical protein MRB53_009278 [Persea americana]
MERTCDFIRTLTQLYRRLHWRQTRIFQFSSAARGGKLAISALPPFSPAVSRIFQVSSAVRGGKLALSALPPLSSADLRLYSDTHAALPTLALAANSHFPAFLRCERRKACNFSFTAVLTGG